MKIDTKKLIAFLTTHFEISIETLAFYEAVCDYWNTYCKNNGIETYLTQLLKPLGLSKTYVAEMIRQDIIYVVDTPHS